MRRWICNLRQVKKSPKIRRSMIKKIEVFLIAGIVLFSCYSSLVFADTEQKNCSYREYEYPVRQSDEQWKDMFNHQEMIDACQLPLSWLKSETIDLLAMVLHYPLLGDIFLWNSFDEGVDNVSHTFNGLEELLKRNDLIDAINRINFEWIKYDYVYEEKIAHHFLEALYSNNCSQKSKPNPTRASEVTNEHVKTPSGTPVPHYENLQWADHGYYSLEDMDYLNTQEEYLEMTYCYASKIYSKTPSYNCHSYAWHRSSVYNPYWINNPALYLSDSYYSAYTVFSIGDRAVYNHSINGITHSAIVTGTYGGAATCASKWGFYGVYSHSIYHCPYYSSYVSFMFYRH